MCGIWALISNKKLNFDYFKCFMNLSSRGPDNFKLINFKSCNAQIILGFHRLSIMDLSIKGLQPFQFVTPDHEIYCTVNGEIYNYKELSIKYSLNLELECDCKVIAPLYKLLGFEQMLKELRGEFAIILIDHNKKEDKMDFYFARDQIGVRPVYFGINEDFICLSSNLDGIPLLDDTLCDQALPSQSYHFTSLELDKLCKGKNKLLCNPYWTLNDTTIVNSEKELFSKIRNTLIESVKVRLLSDRPLGALLSGGLDSSLICAIASEFLKKEGRVLKTFSVGMKGSTDEYYAKKVSKYIGSEHTHLELSEDEFINAIDEVVKVTESYDTTTIRASTGMYLVAKYISENTDIKVVLTGEGSDELCSGYVYFNNAPDEMEMNKENIRLLENLHKYDCQRLDRTISKNGLEARVPFLDYKFIELYLSIDKAKRKAPSIEGKKIEKYLLRKAFEGYLPSEILWRPKEAFSDGVSSLKKSWYEIIQENAEKIYSDKDFKKKTEVMKQCTPLSKESLMYREIFEKHYSPNVSNVIPYYWLPKWCGNTCEPSARILNVYEQ